MKNTKENATQFIKQYVKENNIHDYSGECLIDLLINYANKLNKPCVSNWVSVEDSLPKEEKHRMSADVLVRSGTKMDVKCYDYELNRWSGSPHVIVRYWMELPKPPCC